MINNMLKSVLYWLRQRRRWIALILFFFASVVFFVMGPVSSERLVSQDWCSILPYPLLRWTFVADGNYEQHSIIIDSAGGASGFIDSGMWQKSGSVVEVTVHQRDLLTQSEFMVRATRFGGFLWTHANLLGDSNGKGMFFWRPCPEA